METKKFSRHNDMPQRFLFWQIDQVVPLSTMIVMGALSGNLILYGAIGLGVAWALGRWRDSNPDGYMLHMLYWYGIIPIRARVAINPFLRKIYPL